MAATGEQERARQTAARRRAADLRAAAAAKQQRIRAAELELGLVRSHLGPGPDRTRFSGGALVAAARHLDEDLPGYENPQTDSGHNKASRDACHEGECDEVTAADREENELLIDTICDSGASGAHGADSGQLRDDRGRTSVDGARGRSGSGRVRRGVGYVPSYRERFLADDGALCWQGDSEPPPAGIPGVLGTTIVAVVVVDRDSLERGLRGERDAGARSDASACLAAALNGAAADVAAAVERCFLQHAVIGAHLPNLIRYPLVNTSTTAYTLVMLSASRSESASCLLSVEVGIETQV